MTLKNIFKIIEDREWDFFGLNKLDGFAWGIGNSFVREHLIIKGFNGILYEDTFSLADLLANQSWCKAVWGEPGYELRWCEIQGKNDIKTVRISNPMNRKAHKKRRRFKLLGWKNSTKAFETLRDYGGQEAIDYIYKTMKK